MVQWPQEAQGPLGSPSTTLPAWAPGPARSKQTYVRGHFTLEKYMKLPRTEFAHWPDWQQLSEVSGKSLLQDTSHLGQTLGPSAVAKRLLDHKKEGRCLMQSRTVGPSRSA